MAVSHADCTHPRTPAGRRACRAGVAQLNIPAADHTAKVQYRDRARQAETARANRLHTDEIKMTGPVARRIARQSAKADRIQPRRSGARVSGPFASCVQAALHYGTGRCACGWAA